MAGWLPLFSTEQFSKRSVINMNFAGASEYAFIDMMRTQQTYGPYGTSFATGTNFNTVLDSEGYPNNVAADTRAFGGGVFVPASSNYSGQYIVDGLGSGEFAFQSGTWTFVSGTNCTAKGSTTSGAINCTATGLTRWSAIFTYSGSFDIVPYKINRTDPSANGNFMRRWRMYRSGDASDLAAGKIFRAAYKQTLVDLCPSVIRFMNWTGANDAADIRFENRAKPGYAALAADWNASPPYTDTSTANQMTVASATGMPVSMTHGDIVTCRIGAGMVRCNANSNTGPQAIISNITKANPGKVTAVAHGFNTGDIITHLISAGMTELDHRPITITKVDADNYTLDSTNTSSYTTWTGPTLTGNTNGGSSITGLSSTAGIILGYAVTGPGVPSDCVVTQINPNDVNTNRGIPTQAGGSFTFSGAGKSVQSITLDVGGRGAYPVSFFDGISPASSYGDDYIQAGDYKTFYFDKTIAAKKDASGNWVYGAWLFVGPGTSMPHVSQVPLEYCVGLINEIMAMSPLRPVDMWITTPHMGVLSMDTADYTSNSNFATNQVNIVLSGANGYAGLDTRCRAWVEYTNEWWNSGFKQTAYLAAKGVQRWPTTTYGDYASMGSLRSMIMCKDIKAVFPGNSRVKFVLATQGTTGIAPGSLGYLRAYGTSFVLGDSLNPTAATPISVHDAFAWAAYIENDSSNSTYSLATATTAWLAAGSDPVAKEAAYNLYVQGLKTYCGNETIDRYYDTLTPAYASAMVSAGKIAIMYEGGWNDATGPGQPGWGGTTDNSNFLVACKASQSWATALKNAHDKFNSIQGAYMPADYIETDKRWGHVWPDSYGQAVGGVEWSGLDLSWLAMGTRNRALN